MPKGCVAMQLAGNSARWDSTAIFWNPLGRAVSLDYRVRQVCYESKDPFPGILLSTDLEIYYHDRLCTFKFYINLNFGA